MEGPHNDKDASTFVLAVSSFFILHNNLIHLFDFGYDTIKLDKCHTNKGVWPITGMDGDRPEAGSGGRVTGRPTRPRLTRSDGRRHWLVDENDFGLLTSAGRRLCKARSSCRRAQRSERR